MKALGISSLLLAVCLASVAAAPVAARAFGNDQQTSRTLTGIVTDHNDKPLPNAIVYLKDTKTLTVKTFIAGADGGYRFHALSPNVDYQVHAEINGHKSDVKTLSSFDSRSQARINLHVNMK